MHSVDNVIQRIGFACKWSELNKKGELTGTEGLNTGSTTRAWLNRQSKHVAEEKLWSLMKGNIESIRALVQKVGTLDESLRMVRLGSDILPVYNEISWSYFWRQPDVIAYMERHFKTVGELARQKNVRLSFHPGQFCCIVSENEGIVENSLLELEYHADMMRWMGYGNTLLDAKINIHLSGKKGVSGFDSAWNRMSPELRNMLTLENDEFQSGLDVILNLRNKVGVVLDLHHHWINTGEYIEADDERIKMVVESWCRDGTNRRPTFHYSQSREDVLREHPRHERPSISSLIESGYKKAKLRSHSDYMWNTEVNKLAYSHWQWGDVMVECKSKNLGSQELFEFWQQLENS